MEESGCGDAHGLDDITDFHIGLELSSSSPESSLPSVYREATMASMASKSLSPMCNRRDRKSERRISAGGKSDPIIICKLPDVRVTSETNRSMGNGAAPMLGKCLTIGREFSPRFNRQSSRLRYAKLVKEEFLRVWEGPTKAKDRNW